MTTTSFLLLYVADVRASAQFYSDRLGLPILEESPGFAMLPLPGGAMLGLWLRPHVEPAATALPGAAELAITVADEATLRRQHGEWLAAGVVMLNPPQRMDFGVNFTAADPDGHRLRMFVPAP